MQDDQSRTTMGAHACGVSRSREYTTDALAVYGVSQSVITFSVSLSLARLEESHHSALHWSHVHLGHIRKNFLAERLPQLNFVFILFQV